MRCYTGAATQSNLQAGGANFASYDCVDLQLILSAFRSAYFVDFGITNRLWNLFVKQQLQFEGWRVVRYMLDDNLKLYGQKQAGHYAQSKHDCYGPPCRLAT